jgi:hypothetical protein
MKNIHVLPTDKPSRLFKVSGELKLTKNFDFYNGSEYQNIYITSDEEIKEGDWMIRGNEQPIKVTKDFFWDFGVRYYKIILTTDQDLIADGVQAIDDEFLEWFVENPSCEEVKTRKIGNEWIYNADVPQEEPKQETLEEAAQRLYPVSKGGSMWMPSADDCNKANKQEGFIQGAKWQEERMYSEEEVQLIASKLLTDIKNGNAGNSVE